MTHAFHQIVLSECTSRMLTVNPLGSGWPHMLEELARHQVYYIKLWSNIIWHVGYKHCYFTDTFLVCNSYDDCYKKTREIFLLYVLNEMLFFLVWLNPKSIHRILIWDLKGTYQLIQSRKGFFILTGFPLRQVKQVHYLVAPVFFVTISSISQLNQRHWMTWRRMVFLGKNPHGNKITGHLWWFQTRNSKSIAVNFPITTSFILRTEQRTHGCLTSNK
jgi:hypothetical protein